MDDRANPLPPQPVFCIHPAIGFARVGPSQDFYLAPETMAGELQADRFVGGLPIKRGTEATPITSADLRDPSDQLVRQAARFKMFYYPDGDSSTYPRAPGQEITVSDQSILIDGRSFLVKKIHWTVHLANKKANWYRLDEERGIDAYANDELPPLRNYGEPWGIDEPWRQTDDLNDKVRMTNLVIDYGPRTITGDGNEHGPVRFDKDTWASIAQAGPDPKLLQYYPKLSPSPATNLGSLGELYTDEQGRLLVVAGSGGATSWGDHSLNDDVDNDGWMDDVADGPVQAFVELYEPLTSMTYYIAALGTAWVVTTDPAYAPQIPSPVTLWDDIYDTWVREMNLEPSVCKDGQFVPDYPFCFEDDVAPILRGPQFLRWVTNLNMTGIAAHAKVATLVTPKGSLLDGLGFIRDPDDPGAGGRMDKMPLSLGDAGKSLLSLTKTQYFFLKQWNAWRDQSRRTGDRRPLGPGELLDRAALWNGLGGRFNPGIEMTFICRDKNIYQQDFRKGAGPFRIAIKPLDYSTTTKPVLSAGYIPFRPTGGGLEPGDVSKFMALPWHTDYNSCATHLTRPSNGHDFLFWSWPAQRPVAVFPESMVPVGGPVPDRPWYSVRGSGTEATDPAQVGRYQSRDDIIANWSKIGVVLQATAIEGRSGDGEDNRFLETRSRLDTSADSDRMDPWPNRAGVPGSGALEKKRSST